VYLFTIKFALFAAEFSELSHSCVVCTFQLRR